MADVMIVHRVQRIAVMDDGETAKISTFLDNDGDECAPEDAVCCVAEYGDKWVAIDLSGFAPVAVQ